MNFSWTSTADCRPVNTDHWVLPSNSRVEQYMNDIPTYTLRFDTFMFRNDPGPGSLLRQTAKRINNA